MLSICPWKWFGKSPPAGALGTPWRCWSAAPLGFRAGGRQRVASHRCNGQPWWWWIGWGEKNGKWWVLWNKHSRTSSYMKMSIYLYIYYIYIIILYIYYNIIYIIYIFTHTLYIYILVYMNFQGFKKVTVSKGRDRLNVEPDKARQNTSHFRLSTRFQTRP